MIFICTCSQDGTTNYLLPCLKNEQTFRFNIDKREDYCWDFARHGFVISNVKTAESITSKTLSSFYLRKPMFIEDVDIPKGGCLENWCREEMEAVFRDLYSECEARNLTALVRGSSTKYGKLRQMLVAEKYFNVANWHIFHGALPDELKHGKWVVKSLTGTPIGKGKMLFVKEVDPMKLDLSYPWFLQEKIVGEDEVTVVYVNGKIFAYRYPRSKINACEDVRRGIFEDLSQYNWQLCELSSSEKSSIHGFMAETGYRFGRFDFIRKKNGELWFLELNPNGQWAWLDEHNKDGLISTIANAIIDEDALHRRTAEFRRSSR